MTVKREARAKLGARRAFTRDEINQILDRRAAKDRLETIATDLGRATGSVASAVYRARQAGDSRAACLLPDVVAQLLRDGQARRRGGVVPREHWRLYRKLRANGIPREIALSEILNQGRNT